MIDIKLIRECPELVKENIKKKFQDERLPLVDLAQSKDKEWRELKRKGDALRAERNAVSQAINTAKKEGDSKKVKQLFRDASLIPKKLEVIEAEAAKLENEVREVMMKIPNIIHHSVPIGENHLKNVEVKKFGKIRKFDFPVKSHVELGEELGVLDFDTSAKTSGNGFYYMKGELALLNMAMINFARDFMVGKGYLYVETPLMIRSEVLSGVYSHTEIEEMSYKIDGEDLFLIATSEHPLIGQFIGKTLDKKDLPILQTSYSMCFRKEIGSHGIDEKGIFRTHQFNKQEMIVICEPEESYKHYDEMLKHSCDVFKALEVPFRILECCSGDLGDLKAKSCDLEVWSPRKEEYFEVTSLTNMEESQARRLGIKIKGPDGKYFAHTLNNTVIATSRALVGLIENHQQKDGSIKIPKALQAYMGGLKLIT